jgi:hypothetical protein
MAYLTMLSVSHAMQQQMKGRFNEKLSEKDVKEGA